MSETFKQSFDPGSDDHLLRRSLLTLPGAQKSSESNGLQQLKTLELINIVSLVVFLIATGILIALMKRYFTKYLQFYLIRRDYLRLTVSNLSSSYKSKEDVDNAQKSVAKRERVRQILTTAKVNMMKFHPIAQLCFRKLQTFRSEKGLLHLPIAFVQILISLVVLLTLSLLCGRLILPHCELNRGLQSYLCKMQRESSHSIKLTDLVGVATLASCCSLILLLPGLHFLTKDYFAFIDRLRTRSATEQNRLNSLPDNHPTLQNMLGEDSEGTRRSINKNFPNPTAMNAQNPPLFQINEAAEDEDPFSPSRNQNQSAKKSVLSENKNAMNTSALNLSMQIPKTADAENRINDLPQFNSYTKNHGIDEEVAKQFTKKPLKTTYSHDALPLKKSASHAKSGLNRPNSSVLKSLKQNMHHRHLGSAAGFTDSTNTVLVEQHPPAGSAHKDLHIDVIQEEENKQSSSRHEESSKVQVSQGSLKEEAKDVDSSRVYMMTKGKTRSDSVAQNKEQDKFRQMKHEKQVSQEEITTPKRILISSLIVLVFAAMLILSMLFITYEMFNLTSFGLEVCLIIFGFGVAIDIMGARPLAIVVLSIIQGLISKKDGLKSTTLLKQDEEQLELLGSFYEDYELPLHSYRQAAFNSVLINSMSLKNDQGDSSHLNNADDIEKQQEQEPLRLIKVQSKKKGYRGELMLVESTFFYHDEGGLKSKSHSVSKLEEDATYKERERRRRQTVVVRERVDVSGSLMFNATEEAKFQKAMAYDMRMNEDSNYDIEDIPMHSSRDPQNDRGSCLPPIQPVTQQFETPKGMGQTKIVFNIPGGLNASQQLVTFNENKEGLVLRDLIPRSGSSKKSKALKIHQDYQSLERYLNDDKENANSLNKSHKRQSAMRESIASSLRHQQYLDDKNDLVSPNNEICINEVYKFTPQYSSLQKQVSRVKDSKRSSVAAPDIFSDLKQVNLLSQLQERPKNLRKNSSMSKQLRESQVLSHNGTQRKIQTLLTGRKSIQSPNGSSIKENLEHRINQKLENKLVLQQQIPNVCPFDEDKQGEVCIENQKYHDLLDHPFVNVQSPSKDFNLLHSTDFNQNSEEDQRVRKSGDRRISEQLQPQLLLRKSREKHQKRLFENKQQSSSDQTVVESDYQTKTDSQKMIDFKNNKPIKPQLKRKRHQRKESQATYQTDGTKSYGFSMNGQQTHDILKDQKDMIICERIDNPKHDETSRSKVFEDSDTSTFRLISFTAGASKQRSKKDLHSRQPSSQFHTQAQSETDIPNNIDFYSNTNSQRDPMEKAEQFRTHEMSRVRPEVIIEENLITHHSSPEKINKSPIEIHDANVSFSNESSLSNDNQDQKQQSLKKGRTENEEIEDDGEFEANSYQNEDNIASRLTNRKSGVGSKRGPSQLQKRHENGRLFGQERTTTPSYDTANSNQRAQNEKRKKKEDLELLMLRIEEQRRKLKNFLKLARQLKSTKDEKKIKEFLKYLKEQQKPLAYARIQELKALEIMSSPYNQSLIDMIRDEYNQFKNGVNQTKKPSKSQNRVNEAKNGQLITKLSGIYGSQMRKTKSREGSSEADNYRTKNVFSNQSKNRFGKREFTSKDSVSSIDFVSSGLPPKQKILRGRNQPLLIVEGTINSSFTVEHMRNEEVNVSVESEGITVNDKVKELKVSPKIKSDFNDLQNYMA